MSDEPKTPSPRAWLCLLALAVLLCALAGCSVTPEFERAVQVEIAGTGADVAEWDTLTDAQKKASIEEAHKFAELVATELDIYVPESAR